MNKSREPIEVGSRKQLFLDDQFFAAAKSVSLTMNPPADGGTAIRADRPWEAAGACGWCVVVPDPKLGDIKMYYEANAEIPDPAGGKPLMHRGGNRGLSYNMFRLATLGVQPDLAVLDGVVGMEGNGPVRGTPVEQGVCLASTDWLAADRLGVELMGMDYSEVKYLQWCANAGMGIDDLSRIKVTGPDYKTHIVKYKLHKNIERQREWIIEDFKETE